MMTALIILNNSSCVDGVNNYKCVCSPGYNYYSENYSGVITLNDCDQGPCMNDATCLC